MWVDLPGYIAAAYAYTGDKKEAARYLDIFKRTFQKEITSGRRPQPDEIISWIKMANHFEHDADMDHLVDGIVLAGLEYTRDKRDAAPAVSPLKTTPLPISVFKKDNDLWHMTFEGSTVRIPEVKGFLDLAQLLVRPGAEIHCTDLMGSPVRSGDREIVMDEKARHSYQQRIRDLQAEITQAEQMNDLGRTEKLNAELDQITDHLSKALGIGRRTREFNAPVERARAAVTWRIRSAIRKIQAAHPSLGRHFANSIRTGAFCSYSPEKERDWHT